MFVLFVTGEILYIPNGCLDAYEGKGKTTISIPEIFHFSMVN